MLIEVLKEVDRKRSRRRRPSGRAAPPAPQQGVAARATAPTGTTVGAGALARHPGGVTGRAQVSLLMGSEKGQVLGSDLGPGRVLGLVMVMVVAALMEVAMEVAEVPVETEAAPVAGGVVDLKTMPAKIGMGKLE